MCPSYLFKSLNNIWYKPLLVDIIFHFVRQIDLKILYQLPLVFKIVLGNLFMEIFFLSVCVNVLGCCVYFVDCMVYYLV